MGRDQSLYDYGECHVCGERMKGRRIQQDFWIKRKLIVIQDVPGGVCPRCGEKVVKGAIGKRILTLIGDSKRLRKARTLRVPVIKFAREVA